MPQNVLFLSPVHPDCFWRLFTFLFLVTSYIPTLFLILPLDFLFKGPSRGGPYFYQQKCAHRSFSTLVFPDKQPPFLFLNSSRPLFVAQQLWTFPRLIFVDPAAQNSALTNDEIFTRNPRHWVRYYLDAARARYFQNAHFWNGQGVEVPPSPPPLPLSLCFTLFSFHRFSLSLHPLLSSSFLSGSSLSPFRSYACLLSPFLLPWRWKLSNMATDQFGRAYTWALWRVPST